jgi:hypothetical protein
VVVARDADPRSNLAVAGTGAALSARASTAARRALIRQAAKVLERAAGRCRRSAACSKTLSLDLTETLGIEKRIDLGDQLAADALLAQVVDQLEGIRERLGDLIGTDVRAMARLDAIRRHKQTTGCDAAICSGRWMNKEAGRTDPAGTEPQRSGSDRSKPPRAKAGQRGLEGRCSS